MRDAISKIAYYAGWLAAVLTVLASVLWAMIVAGGNYCWSAFAFTMGIALPLGIGTLLLGVVPSAVLLIRTRRRRDYISLMLTATSFLAVVIEALLMNFVITQRGE